MNNDQNAPFFCDMNGIPTALRKQHMEVTKEVFGAVRSMRELPNGFAFELPNKGGFLIKAAEFIDRERLCCPFFSFAIEMESGGGAIWLHLTGPDGVKPFIQAEIGQALDKGISKAF